ncbi:multicopper oxidase family protein [Nordella sp. HKS 07]|uniref:multicopper oxidase family protein n=1 Tax=Nordella sp. HKS 07 TaxID=2712222 RepID=UPI0013E207BE|nr:multicopper oxidase family protein [Nordella sp. HKS 07]QIG48575.1 multicopper oxidase family protein [Nordella sp. HKS 07]
MLTRRAVLTAAAGGLAAPALLSLSRADTAKPLPEAPPRVGASATHEVTLEAKARSVELFGADGPKSTLWTYGDELFPILRARRGDRLRATLRNSLAEHTSIHWHGVRVPNAMDGVQYVTQQPVEPGNSFVYDFPLPDTGTFFFHPHCNETGQVGHGLVGVLIVEGDESRPFDDELVLIAKDWRLDADGSFLPFTTDSGAARAGTFGTVRTVNGQRSLTRKVPASADIRLRLLNLDSTRMMDVGVEGAEAHIIAIDGNPLPALPLCSWRLGAASRVDLVLRTPKAGGKVLIRDYFPAEIFDLAELEVEGPDRQAGGFDPAPLYAARLPEADLSAAERQAYVFGAASDSIASFVDTLDPNDPLSKVILDELCTAERTFWAINKRSWPNDGHRKLPPPLARLQAGKSYRFMLQNATPHPHPIHLHGHTFKVLSSSRRNLPVHYADTVLVLPKERIEIAFVATPGRWMFHCHILEHLETGMMGYFANT